MGECSGRWVSVPGDDWVPERGRGDGNVLKTTDWQVIWPVTQACAMGISEGAAEALLDGGCELDRWTDGQVPAWCYLVVQSWLGSVSWGSVCCRLRSQSILISPLFCRDAVQCEKLCLA